VIADQIAASDVLTGPEFRQKLRWGKDRFYAAVNSGRFTHLISVNASSAHRVLYVRAKVEAFVQETPALRMAKRA
jgi:hypothetical protein